MTKRKPPEEKKQGNPRPWNAAEYKPNMPEIAFNKLKEGGAMVEVASELNISKDTLYNWIKQGNPNYKPELADAIKLGLTKSEAFWTRMGYTSLHSQFFKVALYIFQMRNRFGWKGNDQPDDDEKKEPSLPPLDKKAIAEFKEKFGEEF